MINQLSAAAPALPAPPPARAAVPLSAAREAVAESFHLNPRIERYFLKLREDPRYLPVSLAVERAILAREDLPALHRAARDTARDQLRREFGREPRRGELLERAYLSAAAAVIARPYQVPGIDQLNHYFVSAALSSRAYRRLGIVPMPDRLREGSAIQVAMAAGVLKEILDIPTSGFDRGDLRVDKLGAKSPFDR